MRGILIQKKKEKKSRFEGWPVTCLPRFRFRSAFRASEAASGTTLVSTLLARSVTRFRLSASRRLIFFTIVEKTRCT